MDSASNTEPLSTPQKSKTHEQMYKMPLRPDYNGNPVQVFIGWGKNANLTDQCCQQILEDRRYLEQCAANDKIAELQRTINVLKQPKMKRAKVVDSPLESDAGMDRRKKPASILADYYGVDKRTIARLFAKVAKGGNAGPRKKPGRPSQLTPTKRRLVKEQYNRHKGRVSLKRLSAATQGKTTWKTVVKGRVIEAISPATLSRLLNDGTWMKQIVRKRPHLDENAVNERKRFAPEALARDDTLTTCHDEAYIEVRLKNGSLLLDVLDDKPENPEEAPVEFDSGGLHEPKIFLFGGVTQPKTFTKEGITYVDPCFDGRVLLAWVRGVKVRKRGRRSNGEYMEGKKPGDEMFEAVTIDGHRYKRLCEMEGGLFDSIIKYHNPELRTDSCTARILRIDLEKEEEVKTEPPATYFGPPPIVRYVSQEDGAPGHGYNNRVGGVSTAIHDSVIHNASLLGIQLLKQSRHSPEFNFMDLGVWNMLKKAVEQRSHEIPQVTKKNHQYIEECIREIVNEEWVNLDCSKLYNIVEQRKVLLQRCIELEGKSITKEPHTGVRKRHAVKYNKSVSAGDQ